MNLKRKCILSILICTMLISCGNNFKEKGLYAVIETNMGDMGFKLFYKKTPITIGNFVGLAEGTKEFVNIKSGEKEKRPFYDGLIFHRVIKRFVIQGGCPLKNGRGNPGYSFIDEFHPDLVHDKAGTLSMANSGPNTNGSQFFITLAPTPHLNRRHTVFGKIVFGQKVLNQIGNVETDSRDKPMHDVEIESIKIRRIGSDANEFDPEKAFAKNEDAQEQIHKDQEKQLTTFLSKLGVIENKMVTTDSGLRYYVRKQGKGKKPKNGDIITAHYTGYLTDGSKFDSSHDRNKPFDTPIGVRRVIPGWDEAFLDMRKGEKRVIVIPYRLAYGERGMPPVIPPKSTLVFDVELIKIKRK